MPRELTKQQCQRLDSSIREFEKEWLRLNKEWKKVATTLWQEKKKESTLRTEYQVGLTE